MQVTGIKDDSKSLMAALTGGVQWRFTFDDHIRCMAAKQRLAKGAARARTYKMQLIANVLGIAPVNTANVTEQHNRQHSGGRQPTAGEYRGKVAGYVAVGKVTKWFPIAPLFSRARTTRRSATQTAVRLRRQSPARPTSRSTSTLPREC